jgi:hypothetical protein
MSPLQSQTQRLPASDGYLDASALERLAEAAEAAGVNARFTSQ